MPTHLNSVTGVPVRHYCDSCRPLRGEFRKFPPTSRTYRRLSGVKDPCILFRIVAFMIENYSTHPRVCQYFFEKYFKYFIKKKEVSKRYFYIILNHVFLLKLALFLIALFIVIKLPITIHLLEVLLSPV